MKSLLKLALAAALCQFLASCGSSDMSTWGGGGDPLDGSGTYNDTRAAFRGSVGSDVRADF